MVLNLIHSMQGAQHVMDREKEIQLYLHHMERVLTQAERMHSSTHVQPARRRHSLSNSQVPCRLKCLSNPSTELQHCTLLAFVVPLVG
jgi:hypothetical protein